MTGAETASVLEKCRGELLRLRVSGYEDCGRIVLISNTLRELEQELQKEDGQHGDEHV